MGRKVEGITLSLVGLTNLFVSFIVSGAELVGGGLHLLSVFMFFFGIALILIGLFWAAGVTIKRKG